MNYNELVKLISEKSDAPQSTIDRVLRAFTESVTEAVKQGETISLKGYFTFKPKTVAARTGINPQTKEPIQIAEKKSLSVTLGKTLKDTLNN